MRVPTQVSSIYLYIYTTIEVTTDTITDVVAAVEIVEIELLAVFSDDLSIYLTFPMDVSDEREITLLLFLSNILDSLQS